MHAASKQAVLDGPEPCGGENVKPTQDAFPAQSCSAAPTVRRASANLWTILQYDGPNHLGLWRNALPGHQMAMGKWGNFNCVYNEDPECISNHHQGHHTITPPHTLPSQDSGCRIALLLRVSQRGRARNNHRPIRRHPDRHLLPEVLKGVARTHG